MEENSDLNRLFEYIDSYTPLDIELDTVLKPFIPEYVPAIGDIDAFIKVPRPDDEPDTLGLTVLDEPCGKQSNPLTLDLKLRALSKATNLAPQQVGSVLNHNDSDGEKAISKWITLVEEVHKDKPAATVQYTKPMHDIDDLMQVWPAALERTIADVELPGDDIDLTLAEMVRVFCTILDIPVLMEADTKNKANAADNGMIESLHQLFTLYSVFNSSQHFSNTRAFTL